MAKMKNEALWISAQSKRPVLAIGEPGVGKTAITEAFAKKLKRHYCCLVGSLRDPADIGGYPMLQTRKINEVTVPYMSMVPPEYALNLSQGRWVLHLDELTGNSAAHQAAFMRVTNERYVGDCKIPDDVIIVCSANPPEMTANGHDLAPALANRMGHFKWEHDNDAFRTGLSSGLEFPEPEFPIVPDNWESYLYQAGSMVSAFLSSRPAHMHSYPKERSRAGSSWPSHRSWTNAVSCLAAAESIHADDLVKYEIVAAYVGEGPAKEFVEWSQKLDLPDPESVIDWAVAFESGRKLKWPGKKSNGTDYIHPSRPDQVMALLSSVVSATLANNTEARFRACCRVLTCAADHSEEIAFSCMRPLKDKAPGGVDLLGALTVKLYPTLHRAKKDN